MTRVRTGTPPTEDRDRTTDRSGGTHRLTRRRLLGTLGATAATAGCVRRGEALLNRDTPEQVSLTIKAPPADDDVHATRIARFLAVQLKAVGIDASVVPLAREEMWRHVLLNHNFDLYVGQFPEAHDPDFLRPLLHSRFDAEPGWQNPFGYANLSVDDLLDAQRIQTGTTRRKTVTSIQNAIAREQPFSVVAFPYEVRAVRRDRVGNWGVDGLHESLGYLSLRQLNDQVGTPQTGTPRAVSPLRVTTTDPRITENLNPLAVEFRGSGVTTDLLYDRLARYVDGQFRPWLATDWHWRSTGSSAVADVSLREGLAWHDGEPLTADDVVFTYEFLGDTSLGSLETPVPAPRFRGRSSLVDSVEVLGKRRVRFRFAASPAVATRALTVPVLPEHVWADLTGQAKVAGIDMNTPATEALIWNNGSPVGSGRLQFRSATYRESVTLEPFGDHFLADTTVDNVPGRYAGQLGYDRLRFVVVPSSDAAVELLGDGEVDATGSPIDPSLVPVIGRDTALELHTTTSRSFYHVGYNLRRSPLRNPRFRRAVARLLDKPYLVDEVFDGYAAPAVSPLAETPWLASGLRWEGRDPELPFPGDHGELDVPSARDAFTEAGYRYTAEERLVSG